jgi:hypothetical protein
VSDENDVDIGGGEARFAEVHRQEAPLTEGFRRVQLMIKPTKQVLERHLFTIHKNKTK